MLPVSVPMRQPTQPAKAPLPRPQVTKAFPPSAPPRAALLGAGAGRVAGVPAQAPAGKGAKGRPVQHMQQQQQQQFQAQQQAEQCLNECIETMNWLFEGVLETATPVAELQQAWQHVLQLRARASQLAPPQAQQQVAAQAMPADDTTDWKTMLNKLYQIRLSRPLTKDEIHYDAQATQGGFVATVTSEGFYEGATYEGEPQPSKKQALQSAAQMAISQEFPEAVGDDMQMSHASAPVVGKKRKHVQEAPANKQAKDGNDGPKQTLHHGLQFLLRRTPKKGEMIFETRAHDNVEEGAYVATVIIEGLDPETAYQGLPAMSKKLAEANACESALEALFPQIQAAEQEHRVQKQQNRAQKQKVVKEENPES